MGQPYVGEIRMFAGNFAPQGWAFCNGQTLAISQFEVLFTLIGTTYGGDGVQTFNVPDLQGRFPIHMGTDASSGDTYVIGQRMGTETVILTANQLPVHTHTPAANGSSASSTNPVGAVWGPSYGVKAYSSSSPTLPLDSQALGTAGNGQPHENMSPFVAITFIISLFGIFPSQT
jgi:microcystin-dependent protein